MMAFSRTGQGADARRLAFVTSLLLSFTLAGGCSRDDERPAPYAGSAGDGGSGVVRPEACKTGDERPCGITLERHDNVASCFKGTQTCLSGRWGACRDGVVTEQVVNPSTTTAGMRALSLSQPVACPNNPCDPYCQTFIEEPDEPVVTTAGTPLYPWQTGSIDDYPDEAQRRTLHEPCRSGADCQFNHQCTNVATSPTCAHDKCQTGDGLASACDSCVQSICAIDPSCCQEATCSGPSCTCKPDEIAGPLGTCYYAFNTPADWQTARDNCRARGAGWDLVSIDSDQENTFVEGILVSNQGGWLGLNDKASEGAFTWSNGDSSTYRNWASGEPNNYNDEDCVELYPGFGAWNDRNCTLDRDQICEGPKSSPPGVWAQSCVDKVASVCNASCGTGTPPNTSGTCAAWLPGQTESTCATAPDLALGVPCEDAKVPVCNHGSAVAPAGITVSFFPAGSGQYPSCAPNAALARGTCMTTAPIAPGQCTTISCAGLVQGDELVVNPAGATHVDECACNDNWALYDETATCGPPVCSGSTSQSIHKQLNMYLVIDRSLSMNTNGKWTGATTAFKTFFADAASAGTSIALEFFPLPAAAGAQGCGQDSCDAAACADPLVPLGTLDATSAPSDAQEAALSAAIDAQAPGGGTPSAPALQGALDFAVANMSLDKVDVVVFVTDGEPTTCLNGDQATTNQALSSLAEAAFVNYGIRTYTVGMEGSNTASLHDIAAKGGTGQAFVIGATNASQIATDLGAALRSIAQKNVSCSFSLPNAGGFNPEAATVTLDAGGAQTTLRRRMDLTGCGSGWYFDDNGNPTTVTLCPDTCAAAEADDASKVRVAIGCPEDLDPTVYRVSYQANCAPTTHVQWSFFAYDSRTPGDSSIRLRARTAPSDTELSASTFVDLGTAQANPDTQVCPLSGPAPCPVDLYAAFGATAAQQPSLELEATLVPTADRRFSPVLNDWKLTYSCPPAE